MDQHQLGLFQRPPQLPPLRFSQPSRPNQCRRILLKSCRLVGCPSAKAQTTRRQKRDLARPVCLGPLLRRHSLLPLKPRTPHSVVVRSFRPASARSQSMQQSQQTIPPAQLTSRSRSPLQRLARRALRQALVNLDSVKRHLGSPGSARRVSARQCPRRL